ncbi:BamA/TamA family outer membrane protein [Flavihumibacter solisilvae]|uniref:Bacterial surface antigen (D15) domain-containing protein n=1 Tax=Flavihumibacter solisilvae TaxID=1349421 RepID=A0A0C1L1C7_9BACT|nr:BamA/TamA family outer membrane protein [Flavihumibacter solisilvae]KIC93436.1 hypothetical protein OI18_16835 [Flavihumibacter solisilvae]
MRASITNTYIRNYYYRMLIWLPMLLASGCKVIKNYNPDKPFVYKTDIRLVTKMPLTDKANLLSRMENQLDDSIRVPWTRKAFLKRVLDKPHVFDTSFAVKSVQYLNDLLRSNGFMYGAVTWDSSMRVVRDRKQSRKKKTGIYQHRVTVNFHVETGKQLKFDSVSYVFRDSNLQALALVNIQESLIKKGEPFTKEKIARELDRLLLIYRNNGYLKISREDIYAEVDTVVAGLIDPGLDPFEQIRLLEEVRLRRENPQIDVSFRQRGTENPVHLHQFRIRNVQIYPDRSLVLDTIPVYKDTIIRNGITILRNSRVFKSSFLTRNNTLIPGRIYKLNDEIRTKNNFGQMSALQTLDLQLFPVDSISVVDARINLYPAKKQNVNVDLEASRNASDVVTTSNLFGLGVTFGYRNKNVDKQSILSNTNLRFGIELGNQGQFIQTFQTSLSQSFAIPKFVAPFRIKAEKNLVSAKTILNANGSFTDRRDFYAVQSINTSIGYDWINKKNRNWFYSPLNIEFVRVFSTDSLENLFDSIPNLRNSFNDGLIISQYLILRNSWTKGNKLFTLKIQTEESGALFGLVKSFDLQGRLSRYVKADVDFRYYVTHPRSSWAFRIFTGVGVPYGQQVDTLGVVSKETNLPFFKSYFAGGPSSMRAWQVRQLGPGSSQIFENTNADRFADVQFEANAEYRFNIGVLFGINVKSALFTDIGNIWYRNNQGDPELDNAVFKFNTFYRDLAVAGGTSLRFDFSYFLIRFDWAYKLKDPFFSYNNNGWFYGDNMKIGKGQFQLGINYPF